MKKIINGYQVSVHNNLHNTDFRSKMSMLKVTRLCQCWNRYPSTIASCRYLPDNATTCCQSNKRL